MKLLIAGLLALATSGAFAEKGDVCTQGEKRSMKYYVGHGDYVVKQETCYSGRWIPAVPTYRKCAEGTRTTLWVSESQAPPRGENAGATCKGGKYKFDNPKYDYVSTKGLNKCKEGKTWIEGQGPGVPGVSYTCKNGRAVRN